MPAKKPKKSAKRSRAKKTSEPFIRGEQRPEVATLLERPIKELTAREIGVVFQSLGIAASPSYDPLELEEVDEFFDFDDLSSLDEGAGEVVDIYEFDPDELEAMYSQLEALNIPGADFRSVPPSELLDYAASLNLPAEVSAVLFNPIKRLIDKGVRDNKGRVDKAIADKARRDKPRIDKAVRDKAVRDKARIDKAARDAKQAADKQIRDAKNSADKALRDQKNRKDLADKPRIDKAIRDKEPAKEAKDISEMFGAAGVAAGAAGTSADVAALANRIQALERSFQQLEASLQGALTEPRPRAKKTARRKSAKKRS